MEKQKSNRIIAVDILRGFTICGMILVNNPGGGEENAYAPLLHAEWIGLTPTDLVFPFFMFIMGITTYMSLKKFNFEWTGKCVAKILKRAFLLWFTGLAIAWVFMFTRGLMNPEYAELGFFGRLWAAANVFENIRIVGVLPRLGICYGIAGLIAIGVKHKFIPWLIAIIFVAYYIILETCNGYAHDGTNIIAIIDNAILGANHLYRWDNPDPEGLLSTIPAVGHVLIGFCVGRIIMEQKNLNDKIEKLFIIGALLTFSGFLLAYGCPISKKLWTPTFALVTCGLASTLLALLVWAIDKNKYNGAPVKFFNVFGVNSLALYIISDLWLIPISILPLAGGTTIQDATFTSCCSFLSPQAASLTFTILFILLNWACGYYLYKKNIYFKL